MNSNKKKYDGASSFGFKYNIEADEEFTFIDGYTNAGFLYGVK